MHWLDPICGIMQFLAVVRAVFARLWHTAALTRGSV